MLHCCAAGLGKRALIDAGVLRLQNEVPQESHALKYHAPRPRQGVIRLKPQDIAVPLGDFRQYGRASIDHHCGDLTTHKAPVLVLS